MQNDGISIIIAIKFVSQMAKPFEEWKAFQLGLINKDGDKIREPKTPEEKKQFSSWMNLIRNLKRMLVRLPGGRSQFASLATAFMMLKDGIERKAHKKISVESLHEVLNSFSGHNLNIALEAIRYRKIEIDDQYYLINNLLHTEEFPPVADCKIIGESTFDDDMLLVKTSTGSELLICRKDLYPKDS